MLIRCPRCSAGYEFPVEQLPPDGLRAKCARCAFVMLVKPTVGAVDPETGDTRVAFKPRGGGSEVTTVSKHREERAIEEGPSIVIDIGQLGPEQKAAAEAAARANGAMPTETPAERTAAAFSPLGTPGARRPTPVPDASTNLAAMAAIEGEPIDLTDMEVIIKPPNIWRLVVAIIVLLLAGFTVYVWARNDWAPIWEDPVASIKSAFEVKERPRVSKSEPPPRAIVQVDEIQGELKVSGLTARAVGQGRHRGVWLQGVVVNASNRAQKAIGVEVSLSPAEGAPPVQTRVVACCAHLDEAGVDAVLADANHPHLDDTPDWSTAARLAPGDQKPFSVIMLDANGALVPTGRIKFSETESAQATAAGTPLSAAPASNAAP
jgi:predicted Zn finger-like uncharacterized protein